MQKPQALLVLQGAERRRRLEMTMEGGRAHGRPLRQGFDTYRQGKVVPDPPDGLADARQGAVGCGDVAQHPAKGTASIVNLTSATTRVATAGVAPYAAFKGGLEVLTRYMAKEFGERRIRANAVSPGAIRTELGGGLNDAVEALLASQTALGRVGEPDDVGRVIASLLSDDGGRINAQTIEVAGGYNI